MIAMRARDNPFRVDRMHALRFRFDGGDSMDALRARIAARGGRGAIVGPHGSGKTTLLLELAESWRREGRRVRLLRIGDERHALTDPERAGLLMGLSADDVVLFDGACHLWPHHWWSIRRALQPAGVLVITAHRSGRLPTALRTRTSPALLVELVRELGVDLADDELRARFTACRGDIRAVFRSLYEANAAGD